MKSFFLFGFKVGKLNRKFSSSSIQYKIIPSKVKKTSASSQDWLTRQLNDPYVKLAKINNYRARSAFKLIEINEKHKILKPGQVVVECGAAPGAWTQVIVSKIKSTEKEPNKPVGKVLSIDLQVFSPVEGAVIFPQSDFTCQKTQKVLENELGGTKADLILSDMAPRASGSKKLDHESIMELADSVLRFAALNSCTGSDLLCKVWDGYKVREFIKLAKTHYESVKIVKPKASRSDSAELFILGRKFTSNIT